MDILTEISELGRYERDIFFTMIHNNNAMNYFLHILKESNDDEKRNFYKDLPERSVKNWENNIFNLNLDNNDKIEASLKIISEIFSKIDQRKKELETNTIKANEKVLILRETMKADFLSLGNHTSDQQKGNDFPPTQLAVEKDAEIIKLPEIDQSILTKSNIFDCIRDRKSRRKFTNTNLSLKELSYLLWSTQGVRDSIKDGKITFRTVPSGGARQPFETYLGIHKVEGVKPGMYRYLPLTHEFVYLFDVKNMSKVVSEASLGQKFVGECAVTFIWSTIPYRCEWRYTTEAKKIILQDSGHLCQNLYLACESIDCGTCGIGAYNQDLMDQLIKVDGKDEFVVYVAPVGKII